MDSMNFLDTKNLNEKYNYFISDFEKRYNNLNEKKDIINKNISLFIEISEQKKKSYKHSNIYLYDILDCKNHNKVEILFNYLFETENFSDSMWLIANEFENEINSLIVLNLVLFYENTDKYQEVLKYINNNYDKIADVEWKFEYNENTKLFSNILPLL